MLLRNLKGRSPASDLFGRKGRAWLAAQELPTDERLTVDAALRQLDFLGAELAAIDRLVAEEAQQDVEVRRLLTIPGVDVTTAVTLVAVIGDVARFPSSRHLVGYLGLHPRVRQSGNEPARHGRLSKQGSAAARHVLVEAAWIAARSPGPLHAFARPSLVRRKLRQLELTAGAPHLKSGPRADPVWNRDADLAERRLAEQAEHAYERLAADWTARGTRVGAGATPGRASKGPSKGKAAR